jgi:opacity protein-like surface antigen
MRIILKFSLALVCLALIPRAPRAGTVTAVEGMSSTVIQEGQSSFSGLAVRLRLHPAKVIEELEFMPSIEYWRNSNTVQPYDIKTMRKDATFGVDVRYRFNTQRWNPYIGAGYALHFLSSRVNAPSLGLDEATNAVTKGGLAALAGVSFGLTGRVDNFFELKYHHVPDYRQLKINWGLSVKL